MLEKSSCVYAALYISISEISYRFVIIFLRLDIVVRQAEIFKWTVRFTFFDNRYWVENLEAREWDWITLHDEEIHIYS
jgi:hypothetical protein